MPGMWQRRALCISSAVATIGELTLSNEWTRLSLTRRSSASCISSMFVLLVSTGNGLLFVELTANHSVLPGLKLVHEWDSCPGTMPLLLDYVPVHVRSV